jgi:hypothetical protein
MRNELCKVYGCYSTGIRPLFRLVTSNVVDGGEGGYVLSSGSVTVSTLIGPQEAGVSLNGGSLGQFANASVLTIAPGQAWSKIIVYCATNASSTGFTPTVGGSAQANICTAQPGSATGNAVTVTNPNTIAAQGATPTTFTLTALGANSFLYGYEAVVTNNAFGLVLDNMGVGGISAPWFAGATGLVWWNLLAGQPALCVLETGENDANAGSGPQTPAQVNANLNVIATNCQGKGASVLAWIPPPYQNGGGQAAYTAIQQGILSYGQANGWDVLSMPDLFVGAGVTQGFPSYAAQNAVGVQALNCNYGLLTCSDNQHPTDIGSWAIFQQLFVHLMGRMPTPVFAYGTGTPIMNRAVLTGAYSNATVTPSSITGWTWPVSVGQTLTIRCRGMYQAASTGGIRLQATGPTMTAFQLSLGMGLSASTRGGSSVTALSTLTTSTAVTTATTNFPFDVYIYANPSAAGTLQIQGASTAAANMTIGVGSECDAR